ncbi:glycoside hydrolase family 25 protein [Myroides sp. LJL110]
MSKTDPDSKALARSIDKVRKTPPRKKVPNKGKTKAKPKNKVQVNKLRKYANRLKWTLIIAGLLFFGGWFGITFKDGIKYLLDNNNVPNQDKRLSDLRSVEVISRHMDMLLGIDVSHYQGVIDWSLVDSVSHLKQIDFVFVRATMGKDGVDKAFKMNWKGAGANHFIRGAYHYYRPDENSVEQAKNFIKNVRLQEGDLPPVLDIEDLPKHQSLDSLRTGLVKWMQIIEQHYKVKPILYSGESYYTDNLKKWFPDQVLWIANYNFFIEKIKPTWNFWQFTDKGKVQGIDSNVDLNIYNGTRATIRPLLIK